MFGEAQSQPKEETLEVWASAKVLEVVEVRDRSFMKGMQSPAVELWSSQERILSCLGRVKQVSPAQGCTQELDLLPAPGSSAWPVGREGPAAPWVT